MVSRIIKLFTNEMVIATAIVLNSVLLFAMGYEQIRAYQFIPILDYSFTIYFILEVVTKIGLRGWKNYIASNWNKFDFFLVAISIPSITELLMNVPDISYLLVFRLLRVMRILRFMRFIPNISKMIAAIRRAFKASIFIVAALIIYNILLAVLSTYLFKHDAPDLFGNPGISLYTIFQIFTLEGWNEIPEQIIAHEQGPWTPVLTRVFFFLVVITGGIFGMSIVNAVFVDEMVSDNNDGLEDKIDALNQKVDLLTEELKQRK